MIPIKISMLKHNPNIYRNRKEKLDNLNFFKISSNYSNIKVSD